MTTATQILDTEPSPAVAPLAECTDARPISAAVRLRDYSELVKIRVTTLVVMTTWCGCYLAAVRSGVSSVSWMVLHALIGVGITKAGTAALNEVMERDVDARMRRTAIRPLVTGHMSMMQGLIAGLIMMFGGWIYLAVTTNWLAAVLTIATSLAYLLAYTPLKRVHPICTFLGAFPGAMPPVVGWVAVRGRLEWPAFILFAVVFFWQFPHFYSIAWLYREDYQRAGIRMLPVVEPDGRSTAREIMAYLIALMLTTLAAAASGMAGQAYLLGSVALGLGYFWYGWRLATGKWDTRPAESKRRARNLLQASVLYLPLLMALMMLNAKVY
jgi:heme o synthase